MSANDIDEDLAPAKPSVTNSGCIECGREWFGPEADECPDCCSSGGAPLACFQCGGKTRWSRSDHHAECDDCDARYPLATVRTHRLGQLVERLARESKTGSAVEVGQRILAAGRAALRRVS